MNQPNSSTSSSEPARKRGALALALWTIAWLVVLDVATNLLFAYPSDPKDLKPGALALYFDYGRSMEGRLRRATRADPAATAPITLSGWYRPLVAVDRPAKPGKDTVTFYGMSHTVLLADAFHRVSQRYSARSVGAPGATTNWSYGAFRRDRDGAASKAVVLGIMSNTLPMIQAASPMTWNTSFAMPYTADVYRIEGGRLKAIAPPYESFADYVRTLNSPAAWNAALTQFARTDPFYSDVYFRQTILDNSTLVRLARRALSQRRDRAMRTGVLDGSGFNAESEPVRIANAIIADFAATARARGQVPVIYIVNNLGYGDQLFRALAPTLKRDAIPYISSHDLVDPADSRGYLPDSHFTPANDERLARALDALLQRELGASAGRTVTRPAGVAPGNPQRQGHSAPD